MHFFYFLLLFLLLSCKDNSTLYTDISSNVIFSAEFNQFETCMTGSSEGWKSGDAIGAFKILDNDSKNNSDDFNVLYLCETDGDKVDFFSQSPLMLDSKDGGVAFMAYYPYNKVLDEGKYPLNIVNQINGVRQFDLMQSEFTDYYCVDNNFSGIIPLRFEHCLSKIVVEFVDENDEPVSVENIEIQGCYVSGTYDLLRRKLLVDYDIVKSIRPFVLNNGEQCEAIVIPSELTTAQKLIYEYDGRHYSWSLINNNMQLFTFQKGFAYHFTHKVGSDNSSGMSHGGNSSSPWEDGGEIEDVVNVD